MGRDRQTVDGLVDFTVLRHVNPRWVTLCQMFLITGNVIFRKYTSIFLNYEINLYRLNDLEWYYRKDAS